APYVSASPRQNERFSYSLTHERPHQPQRALSWRNWCMRPTSETARLILTSTSAPTQPCLLSWKSFSDLVPASGGSEASSDPARTQSNPFSLPIYLSRSNSKSLCSRNHRGRILDESIGQLQYVNKTVLMHAYVDERTECGNVGDNALNHHTGLEMCQL